MELPFNANPNIFYNEIYKNRITHGFIRSELGLPESVKLKLNGTFERDLFYLDEENNVCKVIFKIQTAVWMNSETGKWDYVSIFPCFIKKYCPMSLHLLENISCHIRKGENVFRYIDDPEGLFDCEDPLLRPLIIFEKKFKVSNPSALLNSRYVEVYNQPINLDTYNIERRRFQKVYELILTARFFFGVKVGALSLVNAILQL